MPGAYTLTAAGGRRRWCLWTEARSHVVEQIRSHTPLRAPRRTLPIEIPNARVTPILTAASCDAKGHCSPICALSPGRHVRTKRDLALSGMLTRWPATLLGEETNVDPALIEAQQAATAAGEALFIRLGAAIDAHSGLKAVPA